MVEIVGYILSASATIICGILAYISQKEHKAAEINRKKEEQRAEERRKESLLLMKLIHADCSLTVGTALAIKRGKANGELEQGLKDVEEAMDAYNNFHDAIAVNHLSK